MTELEIRKKYIYNTDYIVKHKLSDKKIREAGIELLALDEIFVQYPRWNAYYGSSHGRMISLKNNKVELLKPIPQGGYEGYKLAKVVKGKQKLLSITCHRVVADIFLPNFWDDSELKRNQFQSHHLDHNKLNNYFKNLILLPTYLHQIMNTVKKMVLFKNGRFKTVTPLEIHEETGLSLDDIIKAAKGKPIKSQGKYSVFDVGNELIGFQFYQKKKK